MPRTTHNISPIGDLPAKHVSVQHDFYDAWQFEFYIPANIWLHDDVQEFVQRLGTLSRGATIVNGATGVWKGEREGTHVYRLIMRAGQVEMDKVRLTIQSMVGTLLTKLDAHDEAAQDAFMVTETAIKVTLSKLLTESKPEASRE